MAWSRTWRIDPQGTGDFATIQAGIDAAAPGDTVLLAAGTYAWHQQASTGHSMISLRRDLTLRGEAGAASTILDASGQGRVLNLRDVGCTRIEHLTIRNGESVAFAPPPYAIPNYGSGILSWGDSQPIIRHCIVSDNRGTYSSLGAGICCLTPGARIEDCEILRNVGDATSQGGGVYCSGATIEHSLVADNAVSGSEGTSCGGIYAIASTISNCTIRNNLAVVGLTAVGGGMRLSGGNVTRCRFINNRVQSNLRSAVGAGLAISGGVSVVFECTFIGNEAIASEANDALGAAVSGGGYATIRQCTVVGNRAVGHLAVAGVYSAQNASTLVSASIVAGNFGLACHGNSLQISCTDVHGNSEGDAICGTSPTDNFSLDPQFCGAAPLESYNVLLQQDSPCMPNQHPAGANCGRIGAEDSGCDNVPVHSTPWGRVKSRYRR